MVPQIENYTRIIRQAFPQGYREVKMDEEG